MNSRQRFLQQLFPDALSSMRQPQQTVAHLFGFVRTACRQYPWDIIWIIVLGLFLSLFSAGSPILSAYIIQHAFFLSGRSLFILILLICIGIACFGLLSYASRVKIKIFSAQLIHSNLPVTWQRFLIASSDSNDDLSSGDMAKRMMDYVAAFEQLPQLLFDFLFSIFSACLLLMSMTFLQPKLCGLFLLCLGFFISLQAIVLRKKKKTRIELASCSGEASGFMNEAMLQITKIRSSNLGLRIYRKWWQHMAHIAERSTALCVLDIADAILDTGLLLCATLLIYIGIYWQTDADALPSLLAFILASTQLLATIRQGMMTVSSLVDLSPALTRMKTLAPQPFEQKIFKRTPTSLTGDIRLDNVSYQRAGRLLIDKLTLHVYPGEFIAIVGASGSGKSTLFKLILGLLKADAGRIYFQGEDSTCLDMPLLRQQIGVVLQTSRCLPGDILTNLTALHSLSDEQAWDLLEIVGLKETVEAMPMKLFTHISDNPSESLSGGQQQKLLIARALAGSPKLLLLDEATSALDNKSQSRIHTYLQKQNITRIVIAHRLSTVRGADRLFKLASGSLLQVDSI